MKLLIFGIGALGTALLSLPAISSMVNYSAYVLSQAGSTSEAYASHSQFIPNSALIAGGVGLALLGYSIWATHMLIRAELRRLDAPSLYQGTR